MKPFWSDRSMKRHHLSPVHSALGNDLFLPSILRQPSCSWNFLRLSKVGVLGLAVSACGEPPNDIAAVSDQISTVLVQSEVTEAVAAEPLINLNSGLMPALKAAVLANDGYQAALRVEAAAVTDIGVVASVRRPQITGNTNIGGIRQADGADSDDFLTGVAAGLNVSQLIYDAGATTAAVNSATAEAVAASAAREVRGNEIALEAGRAWVDVWQFAARVELLRQRTAEMDTLILQMERMAQNGLVDRAAMDSARLQIVDIALEETSLKTQLDEARVRFERLFHRTEVQVPEPVLLLSESQAEAVTEQWQNAPALRQTAAQMLVAQAAVARARAAFRPTASLQAGVRSPMGEGEAATTTVGLAVEFTLGDGGRRDAELESAEARAQAAEDQLNEARRTLQAELAAGITQLRSIARSKPLVAEQIRLSASEAQTSRSQITTGQANLRQLVEAEIKNYRAQDRQIAMSAEQYVALLTLAARTGDLGRRLGLPAESAE